MLLGFMNFFFIILSSYTIIQVDMIRVPSSVICDCDAWALCRHVLISWWTTILLSYLICLAIISVDEIINYLLEVSFSNQGWWGSTSSHRAAKDQRYNTESKDEKLLAGTEIYFVAMITQFQIFLNSHEFSEYFYWSDGVTP